MDIEVSNKAYEYLYATIQTADWINDEYKKLAEQYKNNAALKELYLCICDGVSIDLLEVMIVDDNIEDILKKCRKKHLESDFLRKYSDAVERISVITAKTEKEVKTMSSTVQYIADTLPVQGNQFDIPEPIIVKGEIESITEQEPQNVKEISTKEIVEKIEPLVIDKTIGQKKGFKGVFNVLRNKYRRNPKRTVVGMLKEGYSDEQISFILSCIEEGLTEKEIDKIASPKISVATMMQLKKVVLKEREKNG